MIQYISTREAAKLAGCSQSNMRKKCSDGVIPGVIRYDTRFRINREAFLNWLASKHVRGKEEPNDDPLHFPMLEKYRTS